MTTARRPRPVLHLLAIGSLAVLAACHASAGPAASPSASPSASLPPDASPSHNGNDLPTAAPGGGGSSGNTGSGIVEPAPPGGGGTDPTGGGQAKLVRPQPGQKDPHPVAPIKLESSVDGRHVLVKVSWYSGIEPCAVLDSVAVERVGSEIRITPLEGIGDPTAICIEIAVLKATIVDLGDLDAGTWRITAPTGEATPIEVTIS